MAIVSAVAPITMWTIPLAVLSEHEGGGLETFPLIVPPVAGFHVPEMHELLQPAAQSEQAVSRSNPYDVAAQLAAPFLRVAL